MTASAIVAATLAPHGHWAVVTATDGAVRTAGDGAPPWLRGRTVPVHRLPAALAVTRGGLLRVLWAAEGLLELREYGGAGFPGERRFAVPARVQAVSFAPSGEVAVVGCGDGTIRVLNLETGEFGGGIATGAGNALAVAMAADLGPVAAAFSDGTVRHYDAGRGRCDLLVLPFGDRPAAIAMADGAVLAASPDGTLVRWRPRQSAPLESWATGVAAAALAVGHDGQALLGAADGKLWLYDLAADRLAEFGAAGPSAPRPADVLARPSPGDVAGDSPGRLADDDVRFTVYRPRALSPGAWATLLVFAHKTSLVEREGQAPVDPVEQVESMARAHYGGAPPPPVAADARGAVFRGARLRIVPDLPGIQCNPEDAEFDWWEPVHQAVFRLLAEPGLAGSVVRGAVRVWCGPLLIAEVSLAVSVTAGGSAAQAPGPLVADSASRYRKIFPSYSRDDQAIVEGFAEAVRALGDQYLQDVLALRGGEHWEARLLELIEEADVFQLFWSSNSMRSRHCQDEWEHALSLRRPSFVRPLYWEHPLPSDPVRGLPSAALRELHFVRVRPYQRETTRSGMRGADTGAWPARDSGAQPYGPPAGHPGQQPPAPQGRPRDAAPPRGTGVSPAPGSPGGPGAPYPGDWRPGTGGYGTPPGGYGAPADWGAPMSGPPARPRARRTALVIAALTLVAVIVGVVLAVLYG